MDINGNKTQNIKLAFLNLKRNHNRITEKCILKKYTAVTIKMEILQTELNISGKNLKLVHI